MARAVITHETPKLVVNQFARQGPHGQGRTVGMQTSRSVPQLLPPKPVMSTAFAPRGILGGTKQRIKRPRLEDFSSFPSNVRRGRHSRPIVVGPPLPTLVSGPAKSKIVPMSSHNMAIRCDTCESCDYPGTPLGWLSLSFRHVDHDDEPLNQDTAERRAQQAMRLLTIRIPEGGLLLFDDPWPLPGCHLLYTRDD